MSNDAPVAVAQFPASGQRGLDGRGVRAVLAQGACGVPPVHVVDVRRVVYRRRGVQIQRDERTGDFKDRAEVVGHGDSRALPYAAHTWPTVCNRRTRPDV